jgi:uncharacterized protein (DUF2336 family)
MPAADLSIIDEVERAINTGSSDKPLETIKRVTDLFLSSAGSFNGEQIELFDNVLERLIKTIEIRAIADVSSRIALAELSSQLAPAAQAPPSVVRRLARNDEIAIAGPVLAESARLSAEDLVEIAETKRRAAPVGHFGPLVVEGSCHRRAIGPSIPNREPPDHQ